MTVEILSLYQTIAKYKKVHKTTENLILYDKVHSILRYDLRATFICFMISTDLEIFTGEFFLLICITE